VGADIERESFEDSEYERFAARLEDCLEALSQVLARPGFGEGPLSIGAELELFLIDEGGCPLPLNQAVLRETVDPRLTVELDRFNLECNLRPAPLAGRPFSALAHEIDDALAELSRAAGTLSGRLALIGILPTLRPEDLQSTAMTDSARFRALSASLLKLRGEPFRVRIDGLDSLDVRCDDVTLEGANTSLQVHLRVAPSEFVDVYNAVQLATGPALAVAGNSPTFLGHRLWEETRIALFKQAVDDRSSDRGGVARVSFGSGWLRDEPWDLFAEMVRLHAPLLPVLEDEEPLACVRDGGVPELGEMRLHQGTVWRWNRAIYDPADGGHLRVEMRSLPAGPTVRDMVANSAFLVGLGLGLAPDARSWTQDLPFGLAEHNFYRAAQQGLEAELAWPGKPGEGARPFRARDLVLELVDVARRGLVEAGVEPDEAEDVLQVVEHRARGGRTAAAWQRATLAHLEPRLGRPRALSAMLEQYLAESASARPVHEWPIREEPGPVRVLEAPRGDEVPESPEDLLRWLAGPAVLRLPGRDRARARAVATLLHGNEPSGLRAVHAYLRAGTVPAVDTVFFLGAVDAALAEPGFAFRQLPGALDLNRCFLPPHEGREGEVARAALALLRGSAPDALVDLHNNTGHSPAYGVVPRVGPVEREVVAFFAHRVVQSDLALGALVEATAALFPSVTVECGRAGDSEADAVASEGLARFLAAPRIGESAAPPLEVYHDPVRVKLRPGVRLVFASRPQEGADLTLTEEVDRHNFERLPAGTPLGWVASHAGLPLEARDPGGNDRTLELFDVKDGRLRVRRGLVPIMMTTNPEIAAQDCLFYAVSAREDEA